VLDCLSANSFFKTLRECITEKKEKDIVIKTMIKTVK
jgi:hypothetical protein